MENMTIQYSVKIMDFLHFQLTKSLTKKIRLFLKQSLMKNF